VNRESDAGVDLRGAEIWQMHSCTNGRDREGLLELRGESEQLKLRIRSGHWAGSPRAGPPSWGCSGNRAKTKRATWSIFRGMGAAQDGWVGVGGGGAREAVWVSACVNRMGPWDEGFSSRLNHHSQDSITLRSSTVERGSHGRFPWVSSQGISFSRWFKGKILLGGVFEEGVTSKECFLQEGRMKQARNVFPVLFGSKSA